ncbi:unnamed protein product, partial [Phaeothamnion confervicola]
PLALSNAADAVEILSAGYIMTSYRNDDGSELTGRQKQLLMSSVFFGMLVGGLCCGALADRVGRRRCLLGALALNSAFGLLSAAAPTIGWLVAARVAAGVGVGGSIPVVFTLGAELFPTRVRGALLTVVASCWMFGAIFSAGAAWLLLGEAGGAKIVQGADWRHYAIVAAVPALMAVLAATRLLPESPRFLLGRGRAKEAAAVLNRMMSGGIGRPDGVAYWAVNDNGSHTFPSSPPLSQIKLRAGLPSPGAERAARRAAAAVASAPASAPERSMSLAQRAQSLMAGELARTTWVLMAVWFALSYGSYGIATWNNQLFRDFGLGGSSYLSSFLFALANLPGNVVSVLLIERVGRKPLLAWSMALAAAAASLFAFAGGGGAALVVGAAALFNAFSVAGWNCLDCLSAECFPTSSRTSGMGLVSACGRAGSIAAQWANGSLESSVPVLLLVTSGLMLAGALVSLLLPREMKG